MARKNAKSTVEVPATEVEVPATEVATPEVEVPATPVLSESAVSAIVKSQGGEVQYTTRDQESCFNLEGDWGRIVTRSGRYLLTRDGAQWHMWAITVSDGAVTLEFRGSAKSQGVHLDTLYAADHA